MTATVKYAVSAPNMGEAPALVGLASEAERAGWDGFFLWDHIHWVRSVGNDIHDPWVLMGAIARETERVTLGALVTPVARRRPQKLAKEIVTVDHLSGGRVVVGVGLGAPTDDEFVAFGDTASERERGARLDEGLAVLDGLLTGEPFRHDGDHFQIDAHLKPAPVQRPRPPIWVAGVWPNRRPFERAARWDGVVPLAKGDTLTPEDLAAIVELIGPRPGYQVVATVLPGVDPAELVEAGATWLVWSDWPIDDWWEPFRDTVRAGPPDT